MSPVTSDAKTLPAMLDARAARYGSRTALYWQDEAITYAALADDSRRVARGLAAAGLARGDRVAIWMPNCPEWLLLAYGCWRLGVSVVVVNVRASAAEVAELLARSGSTAIACKPGHGDSRFGDTLRVLGSDPVGACRLLIAIGPHEGLTGPGGSRTIGFDELIRSQPSPESDCRPDDVAAIFSTSGSTGRAKLVVHAQASLVAHASDVARRFGLEAQGAVQLLPVPLAGAYGVTQALASLWSGNPLVMMEAFEPATAAALIRRHQVTSFCAFDEIIDRLMATDTSDRPFPSLQWCGYGIFNPSLHGFVEATERRGVRLVGLYGSSETQAFFATQHLEAPLAERRTDGGFPVSDQARFRIRDMDTGELLGPGKTGEIEVTGPSVFLHYLADDEANAAQRCADGFFRTGDSGHVGANGSLVFEARMQDVLRLSGYLVATREIEAVVGRLPGIAHCQVVGSRTPEGMRPVAFVVPAPGAEPLDSEALRRACVAKLAIYKVPIAFHAIAEFPMTGSVNAPKVNKRRLAEMVDEFAAGQSQSV